MFGCRWLKEDHVALIIAECDIAVAHERRNSHMLIRREPCDFCSRKDVPYNRSISSIVADRKASRSSLANTVHRDPLHVLAMQVETSLDRKGVMVKHQHYVPLRI